MIPKWLFQSTRPVWGATKTPTEILNDIDVSIHAPRVGRDRERDDFLLVHLVSIHAPRVGRDLFEEFHVCAEQVSIHAPRVGRDSTVAASTTPYKSFNPRAPCGARRCL